MNYSKILILEDDAIIKDNYLNIFRNAIRDCIKNNIKYDILQLSGNFRDIFDFSPNLYKIKDSLTTLSYIIDKNTFDFIIDNCEKSRLEIDTFYNKNIFSKNNSFCVKPKIVTNLKDISSITKVKVHYKL